MLLLNIEELCRKQIPCVKKVNKSWNKKLAKTSITERQKNDTASVCQQIQLELSSVIMFLKERNKPLEIVWFQFMISLFIYFISPSIATRLLEQRSFKCKPTSDVVWGWFVYGVWWLAAEMQDSLGTGPVTSRQARDD